MEMITSISSSLPRNEELGEEALEIMFSLGQKIRDILSPCGYGEVIKIIDNEMKRAREAMT